jgi:C1A family cysteine protease
MALRDTYDIRDLQATFRQVSPAPPQRVDLRVRHAIHVYNQGAPPTCTAHAVASAFEVIQNARSVGNAFMPSRAFLYFNTRALEGTAHLVTGASLRNAIKTFAKEGVCDETMWPYDTSRLTVRPPAVAYANGPLNRITRYARLARDLAQIRRCLWSGHPFVFGMPCFNHWYSAVGGVIPAVTPATAKPIGGHAMVCVGYDDVRQSFLVLNSWGSRWGDNGFAHVPYSLILSGAYDMWIIFETLPPSLAIA